MRPLMATRYITTRFSTEVCVMEKRLSGYVKFQGSTQMSICLGSWELWLIDDSGINMMDVVHGRKADSAL